MAARKTKNAELTLEEIKSKVREQLAIDRYRLLKKMPFIGSLLMRLELVPVRDDRLQTAATNGDDIFFDVDFYGKLTLEERLFVLAHEAWHCALLHFMRQQTRDPELFNVAADLEIHFLLTREGLKAPFVLPHDPAWNGLSAEEIYGLIANSSITIGKGGTQGQDLGQEQRGKKQDVSAGRESENIKNTRKGGGFDTHLDKGKKLGGNNDGSSSNASKDVDEDYSPEIKEGAAERCRERLTAVVQQYQRTKGNLPLGVAAIVEKVLEPKINWREILAQFVTKCYGGRREWLPPSRRHVWQGVYLQSSRTQRLNAVVAVDTSGSTIRDLPRFFAELGGLLSTFGTYELTVIQCDAKIQKIETFDDFTPFPPDYKWEAKGFGGTDFRPVFTYVEEHPELTPDLLVYLTDGYGNYPERAPSYHVLWLLPPDGKIMVEWGLRCVLEEDGMDDQRRV